MQPQPRSDNVQGVLQLAQRAGVIRPRDLAHAGIDPAYLRRLYRAGQFERVGRGLYVPVGWQPTEHAQIAQAAKRVPRGVLCLLSALRFHELGTQQPYAVWLAIGVKDRRPRETGLPLQIVRFSGAAYSEGVEEHELEGVPVRVYGLAKTIADCFKYRNKIGLDVALEALRDGWRRRRVTMDELWRYARACRMTNVMRPYLESLT
ncbi:MAG TPA: type IV toxin-antitoxin system AbiEi family antitoxin domain-containing protein [Dehalococcoidia bacterium]|nr:type IV toxin-antitoxin system AbiEi family antitoxin domain-containing protein [Dehalococcoidia bacterium]